MDGKQFDRIVKSLATNASRRGVIGGGIAAIAGLVSRSGSAQDKVTICHFTGSANNPYNIITVDDNSVQLQSHLSHGDTLFVNCCLDEECDDGIACTIDTCVNGTCVFTPDNTLCDDGVACTVDTCDATLGCVFTPDNTLCDDADACTIDTCDATLGCQYESVNCDDSNACTIDSCDPDSGCTYEDVVCDDDDVCTENRCDPDSGCFFPAVVCGVDETCCPGTGCTNLASDEANCRECGSVCPEGHVCCEGICTAGTCAGICSTPINCPEGEFAFCGPAEFGCLCGSTTEGGFGCGEEDCTDVACSSSAECVSLFGVGAFCETTSCCGTNECVFPCGFASLTTSATGGRTRASTGE
jgi:hypothetical protein